MKCIQNHCTVALVWESWLPQRMPLPKAVIPLTQNFLIAYFGSLDDAQVLRAPPFLVRPSSYGALPPVDPRSIAITVSASLGCMLTFPLNESQPDCSYCIPSHTECASMHSCSDRASTPPLRMSSCSSVVLHTGNPNQMRPKRLFTPLGWSMIPPRPRKLWRWDRREERKSIIIAWII